MHRTSDSVNPAPDGRPSLFVSTGSTSSDVLLAPVLAELQRRGRIGHITGIGGAPLRELGIPLFSDTTTSSSTGIFAGLAALFRNAGEAMHLFRRVTTHFRRTPPSLVILVDNPGLNLRFLDLAHTYGLRVMYYIPPELWSVWRWEARAIIEKSEVLGSIFGPEGELYRAKGANVRWVGHPSIDLLGTTPRSSQPAGPAPLIGLFPGSRRLELLELLPVLKGAAEIIRRSEPQARFVICSANDMAAEMINRHVRDWSVPVEVVHRQSQEVLKRIDLLLTCSGTATLEAAILGVPMVVMYRIHHLFDRLLQMAVLWYFPFFSLPNYLLNRQVVPELRNQDANPQRLADEGLAMLRDPERRADIDRGLADVRAVLGPRGAIGRTADLIEEMLGVGAK